MLPPAGGGGGGGQSLRKDFTGAGTILAGPVLIRPLTPSPLVYGTDFGRLLLLAAIEQQAFVWAVSNNKRPRCAIEEIGGGGEGGGGALVCMLTLEVSAEVMEIFEGGPLGGGGATGAGEGRQEQVPCWQGPSQTAQSQLPGDSLQTWVSGVHSSAAAAGAA